MALFLSLSVLTVLPVSNVYAAQDGSGGRQGNTPGAWDGTTIDVSWYHKTDTEFYISTPEQLMGLAAIVNGIYNEGITNIIGDASCIVDNRASGSDDKDEGNSNNLSTADYHYGGDNFSGRTVYLTNDLDMGAKKSASGLWSGPNYMPIGGQYLMTKNDSSTKISASFCGSLNGQGHTVSNIYCERQCTTGNYGDGQSVGLIGRLGVHDDDSTSIRPVTPTVSNLAVTGAVRSNRSVGGIVGKIGKTSGGAVIENCANFASVSNSDAKGCGGIVGAGWNSDIIRNCYNAGSVTTTYACPTGGISGSNEVKIENCYNVGTITATSSNYAMAIGTNNSGGIDVDNCYYLAGSAAGGGYYGNNNGTVTELTEAQMKADDFPAKLGTAFTADTYPINNGYPVLTWQNKTASLPPSQPSSPAPAQSTFTDVNSDDWYYDAVNYVVGAGWFNGTGNGKFSPQGTMTRSMFATVLYRMAGSPAIPAGAQVPSFGDVNTESWYGSAVGWASLNGYVNGIGGGQFDPEGVITLEQMITILWRQSGSPAFAGNSEAYGEVSDFAGNAVAWAQEKGLLSGVGGTLTAKGSATRAQIAAVVRNYGK